MSESACLDLADIHDAYYATVVARATKFLGRADADDVAQEAIIKIDRSLGAHSDTSKLSAWSASLALAFAGPASPWGFLGIAPIVTVVGWCPPCALLGIDTSHKRER